MGSSVNNCCRLTISAYNEVKTEISRHNSSSTPIKSKKLPNTNFKRTSMFTSSSNTIIERSKSLRFIQDDTNVALIEITSKTMNEKLLNGEIAEIILQPLSSFSVDNLFDLIHNLCELTIEIPNRESNNNIYNMYKTEIGNIILSQTNTTNINKIKFDEEKYYNLDDKNDIIKSLSYLVEIYHFFKNSNTRWNSYEISQKYSNAQNMFNNINTVIKNTANNLQVIYKKRDNDTPNIMEFDE